MNSNVKEISAIVAHDAGGARVVSAFVASLPAPPRLIVSDGPAKAILKERFPTSTHTSDVEALRELNSKDFVLTGTSYPAILEKQSWKILKELGVSHAAYLDHWVNYRVRFENEAPLPDEIWVGDEDALAIAKKEGFSESKLRLVPNLHFEELRREILSFPRPERSYGSQRLLFLCEPISQDARDRLGNENAFGFTEISLIRDLIETANFLFKRYSEIVFRPHPLDPPDRFDYLLPASCKVRKTAEANYLADIVNSDTVSAVESMGLVIALLSMREAVSIVPSNLYTCHLPQKEIRHIKSFKELCD